VHVHAIEEQEWEVDELE
jgi:hypothetical protein